MWKPRLVYWLWPAAVDQKDHFSVFFNKLPAPLDVRSKNSPFFSQKSIEILSSTATLTNFYLASSWQSLLTSIWFSSLTISHWFFIRVILLNSGSEMPKSRIKKQQAFLKSAFFRKKIRTTNIGKGFWKILAYTFRLNVFQKRVYDGMKN